MLYKNLLNVLIKCNLPKRNKNFSLFYRIHLSAFVVPLSVPSCRGLIKREGAIPLQVIIHRYGPRKWTTNHPRKKYGFVFCYLKVFFFLLLSILLALVLLLFAYVVSHRKVSNRWSKFVFFGFHVEQLERNWLSGFLQVLRMGDKRKTNYFLAAFSLSSRAKGKKSCRLRKYCFMLTKDNLPHRMFPWSRGKVLL